jgi:hypothetical protein
MKIRCLISLWILFFAGIVLAQEKEKVVGTPPVESRTESMANSINIGAVVIDNEKTFWEKRKGKDVKAIEKYLSEEALSFDEDGTINTKTTLLNGMPDFQLADYSLEHFKAIVLDKDTAIVVYKATQSGTYKGTPLPSYPLNCSTTWIKRNKQWVIAFHQETPIR